MWTLFVSSCKLKNEKRNIMYLHTYITVLVTLHSLLKCLTNLEHLLSHKEPTLLILLHEYTPGTKCD